ncbi:DUF4189 domain-containing protein [Nocardia sp. NBC_01503]|uniref:DUF4189 domain-containing protein n=1 Tax=Nocardia sp. NBC_01503 TaxID=2975997 RepID=UPI002E7BDC41|nr:DUF4189 domain-containing protein [Nocardia sp. NBC_01503]WTL32129.1 DUF4189 domain-containing protein [Nocardia sp. NBC_01503]
MALVPKLFGLLAMAAIVVGGSGIGVAAAEPGPDGRYYGSLATEDLGDHFGVMWAVNYPNWAEADDAALRHCESGNCAVQARFVDGCGSIAQHNHRLLGGVGHTREEAERAALDAFGPPDLVSLSAGNPPAAIAHTECTGNAG